MDFLISKRSWLTAPVLFCVCSAVLLAVWAALSPDVLIPLFDQNGASPVELMTLPLFALIIPVAWLCPTVSGGTRRQCLWASLWSLPQVEAHSPWLEDAKLHGVFVHQFTHYKLDASVWVLNHAASEVQEEFSGSWYHKNDLAKVGLPAPIRSFIEQQFGLAADKT